MMFRFLLLSLIVTHCTCFIDYTSEHILYCNNIDPSLTFVQSLQYLWQVNDQPRPSSILHYVDRILYLIFPPILMLVEILFIMVFIKYRETLFRRQGTIFFAIIVIQTVLNAYYFTHACTFLYDKVYATINSYSQPMPESFPAFCAAFGIVNELTDCALDLYLFYFVIYTFLNMKTSIKASILIFKKEQVINIKVLHISVWVTSFAWILFIILDKRLSINQFGLCGFSSLRYNTVQWFFSIFLILRNLGYLGFAIYTYYYFKKHMPVNDSLVKRIYYQNQSISYFVIVYSVLIMLFNVSVGAVYFNCFRQNPIPSLLTFATVMNITRILQAIFLLYFIMTDLTIKKKTKKFLRSFFQPKRSESASAILDIKNIDFSQPDYEDLDITLKQKILELKEEQHQIDLYKIAQIATMISGICVCHMEYFNTKTFTTSIRKIHFKQKITFQIEPKALSDYKIQVSKLPKSDILKCTITMLAPRIFSQLLHSDGLINVDQSFDLSKNYHKMYNIAEGKGGSSGQFFFFSYDNQYVLKTINKNQYNFILQNLEEFFEYYQKNPKTLLAKIYGLYTIKGDDIGRQYDLILMKNVFGCQKKQILRTYDIKGSKSDRQVIKEKEKQIFNELQNVTLKDTDFIKREGKIHIARQKIKDLRAIIRKDTLFLKNFNLIDYSLLLIRVKWSQNPVNLSFWHEYQRIPSSINEKEFYHIGIIDYMQAWNISKKSQNWFKSLLGKKEISSQEPNFYQRRFMHFFQQITYFPDVIFEDPRSDFAEDSISQNQEEKKKPSQSNLKFLELSTNPTQFIKTQKKQSNLSGLQKQLIIPKDISFIQRKQSVNQSDIIYSLENQLIQKSQSSGSDISPIARKNAILSFKELNSPLWKGRQMESVQEEEI